MFGDIGAAIAVVIGNALILLVAWLRTAGLPARAPLTPMIFHVAAGAGALALLLYWRPNPIFALLVAMTVMALSAIADRKFFRAIKSLANAKSGLDSLAPKTG